MDVIGTSTGVRWAVPQTRHVDGVGSVGRLVTDVAVTWSLDGPPHLELIEGGPGTPWATRREAELHHTARWCEDLRAEAARLRALGWELELTGSGGGGEPSQFAYLRRPDGLRVELMDRAAMQPSFDRWLAGGDLPPTVA